MVTHYRNLATYNTVRGQHVHAAQPDALVMLCRRATKFRIIEGTKVQLLWETSKPITCAGCKKGLEMVVREQIQHLRPTQLEALIDQITRMRKEGSS
jgi:hypothetical protein